MCKLLKVKTLPPGNQFLPAPLKKDERVIMVNDVNLIKKYKGKYLKVRHNKGQTVSVFSKGYFTNMSSVYRKD